VKAIVCTRYGPPEVLQLREMEKPSPKDREVLIRICATTVTAGDCELRGFRIPTGIWLLMRLFVGLRRPRRGVLGSELAGDIESVGKEVTRFKEGDQVVASTGLHFGAYAEYVCLPETSVIAAKPARVTYEEAATLPLGGLNALHLLRKGRIQAGEKVLINGAGGSIGTYAVQLAKYYGAEVTAVDSQRKLDMLRSIGADQVMDYAQQDYTKSGETYDVIFDVVGKSSFSGSRRSLAKDGRYLLGNPNLSTMIRGRWASMTSNKKVFSGGASGTSEDLSFLTRLMETGEIRSVIDRRYRLEQMVEAQTYVETGEKKGHVVITVRQD
jgi:NADPH:quinone reductase-like Zn-dependent oxidoreductase